MKDIWRKSYIKKTTAEGNDKIRYDMIWHYVSLSVGRRLLLWLWGPDKTGPFSLGSEGWNLFPPVLPYILIFWVDFLFDFLILFFNFFILYLTKVGVSIENFKLTVHNYP